MNKLSSVRRFAFTCITALLGFAANLIHGQEQAAVPTRSLHVLQPASNAVVETEKRFDLDFPGGSPRDLIKAMEKASGEGVNAIITDENNEAKIPAINLRKVTVAEVFTAITAASETDERQPGAFREGYDGPWRVGYTLIRTKYGFTAIMNSNSRIRYERPIWSFYWVKVVPMPELSAIRAAKFYQLGAYLDPLTVDDITTAIQTAWRIMDNAKPAELSYHKETQILIAVGEDQQLAVVDSVLQVLPRKEVQSTNAPNMPKFAKPTPVSPRIELPPDTGKKPSSPSIAPAKK